jgi:hypothetical protein
MINLASLTTAQLNKIISVKEQIEALQGQIDSIVGGANGIAVPTPFTGKAPKKRRMSAAARAKIAAAQRARWARTKGNGAVASKPAKKKRDRRSSPAVRAKLAAAARARWKKARAAGKTTL